MPKPLAFVLILAVGITGYVLGAKAGRSRYREISANAKKVWNDPALKKARKRSHKALEKAAAKITSRMG